MGGTERRTIFDVFAKAFSSLNPTMQGLSLLGVAFLAGVSTTGWWRAASQIETTAKLANTTAQLAQQNAAEIRIRGPIILETHASVKWLVCHENDRIVEGFDIATCVREALTEVSRSGIDAGGPPEVP